MKQYDKRKNQHKRRSNAEAVAKAKGTASFKPPPFQLKGAEQGAPLHLSGNKEILDQDFDLLNREDQYEYALVENDYDPEKVQGYDEFKPGGFRFNPSRSYNLAVKEQQLGYRIVGAQKVGRYWADPSTEAGRVMKAQHGKHGKDLLYGRAKGAYEPSDELVFRQTFQQLGEEQVKKNTITTLQYLQVIKTAIQLKIKDQAAPTNEKNNYLAKDAKIDTVINQLLAAIGGLSEEEAPEVTQANFAIPIRWALSATIGAAFMAGTALTLLMTVLFRDVHETLEDVVDAALEDLLRDTGVERGKEEKPTPEPSKTPKPVPPESEDKEDNKPLEWHPTTKVEKVIASKGIVGGLKEKKSKIPRTDKQYWWHAHHPWPKFMGGKEEQPKMGVQSYVHISMLHPMLAVYLKGKGYKVAVNKGPKELPNRDFVDRLKNDAIFKARVMVDLMTFYADLNAITKPKIPNDAYGLGIKYTFKNLK